MTRRIAPVATIVALLLCFGVGSSLAAKRGTAPPCSGPTLTGPSGATVGTSYSVEACGFQPGQFVGLTITEAGGCCRALNTVADGAGRFTYSGYVSAPGRYAVMASVVSRNRWRAVAQWSFDASS